MQSARSLISKLKKDYPDFKFCKSNISHWSYTEKTIFYEDNIKHSDWILLHEISHAILNHKNYTRDIELLSKERDAWNFANTNLALKYEIQRPYRHIPRLATLQKFLSKLWIKWI